jgi:DnaJ-class molecular chaperone
VETPPIRSCTKCSGSGVMRSTGFHGPERFSPCGVCDGSGRDPV